MNICNNCGNENDEQVKFCAYCGSAIEEVVQSDNKSNKKDTKKGGKKPLIIAVSVILVLAVIVAVVWGIQSANKSSNVASNNNASDDNKEKKKQKYDPYRKLRDAEVGDTVELGEYDNYDIKWDVLDKKGNKLLLITKKALCTHVYDQANLKFGEFHDTNWEQSQIRSWLNGTLINEMFEEDEKSIICDSTISNPGYENFYYKYRTDATSDYIEGSNPCGDTTDKLFLLSWEELEKYYGTFETNEEGLVGLDELKQQGQTKIWWLRSIGNTGTYAMYVDEKGCVHGDVTGVVAAEYGVRPAMWIEIPDND